MRPVKILIRLRESAGWSKSLLGTRGQRYIFRCSGSYFLCSYVQIQEHIAYHTEIPADKQLIISFRQRLTEIVDERTKIESYPKTVFKHHILVFEKENYDSQRMDEPDLREW